IPGRKILADAAFPHADQGLALESAIHPGINHHGEGPHRAFAAAADARDRCWNPHAGPSLIRMKGRPVRTQALQLGFASMTNHIHAHIGARAVSKQQLLTLILQRNQRGPVHQVKASLLLAGRIPQNHHLDALQRLVRLPVGFGVEGIIFHVTANIGEVLRPGTICSKEEKPGKQQSCCAINSHDGLPGLPQRCVQNPARSATSLPSHTRRSSWKQFHPEVPQTPSENCDCARCNRCSNHHSPCGPESCCSAWRPPSLRSALHPDTIRLPCKWCWRKRTGSAPDSLLGT